MKLRTIIAATIALSLLAGCGGSSNPPASSDTQPLAAFPEKAGPAPSEAAKMVCSQEARTEIAVSLGVRETRVTKPTWANHEYSCTYVYPKGEITLSVKELVSAETTTDYFDGLARTLGRGNELFGLGQGAFLTGAGNAVVRKDYKVLVVDVQTIPTTFTPTLTRSDVATNITTVIMGCWTGA